MVIRNDQILAELVEFTRHKGDTNLIQISSLASAHQYLLLYQLFQKYVPKGSKVLDWGTGNGHFSYFLCRSGYQTTGFSFEDFTFKPWLRSFPYKFVQGQEDKPTKLPFKNNSFDVVVSVGVLEHVREYGGNEVGSLKEIARILKPTGLFICYHLPNRYSFIEYLSKALTQKFHHQFRFTKKDIENLTKNNGFKILEIRRYGILPRNSFFKLPPFLKYSNQFAYFWDFLDYILSFILSPICQNYYFILVKVK